MNRAILLALYLVVCLLHPMAEWGCDSDEALEMGGQAILRGESPYRLPDGSQRTTYGICPHTWGPITPTIGYMLLYLPVCFGLGHWLTTAIVFWWISRQRLLWQIAVICLWFKIGIMGNDYVSNAVLVLFSMRACALHAPELGVRPTPVRT